jgi:hypothetical protein
LTISLQTLVVPINALAYFGKYSSKTFYGTEPNQEKFPSFSELILGHNSLPRLLCQRQKARMTRVRNFRLPGNNRYETFLMERNQLKTDHLVAAPIPVKS